MYNFILKIFAKPVSKSRDFIGRENHITAVKSPVTGNGNGHGKSGTAETGGLGGYSPPSFGAKVYKLTKLKAKVVNILKICQVFDF